MKRFLLLFAALGALAALAGCAVVPYPEPAVVVAAPPPPAVVVRPAYRYHGHYGRHHRHHYHWR